MSCIACNATGFKYQQCPTCKGLGHYRHKNMLQKCCTTCGGNGVQLGAISDYGNKQYIRGSGVCKVTCTLCKGDKKMPTELKDNTCYGCAGIGKQTIKCSGCSGTGISPKRPHPPNRACKNCSPLCPYGVPMTMRGTGVVHVTCPLCNGARVLA